VSNAPRIEVAFAAASFSIGAATARSTPRGRSREGSIDWGRRCLGGYDRVRSAAMSPGRRQQHAIERSTVSPGHEIRRQCR
jgi:hypothetical protein